MCDPHLNTVAEFSFCRLIGLAVGHQNIAEESSFRCMVQFHTIWTWEIPQECFEPKAADLIECVPGLHLREQADHLQSVIFKSFDILRIVETTHILEPLRVVVMVDGYKRGNSGTNQLRDQGADESDILLIHDSRRCFDDGPRNREAVSIGVGGF